MIKTLYPMHLSASYGLTPLRLWENSIGHLTVLWPLFFTFFLFLSQKSFPGLLTGWILWLLGQLPHAGLLPLNDHQWSLVADYTQYLPMLGVSMMVAATVPSLFPKGTNYEIRRAHWCFLAMLTFFVCCSHFTLERFQNDITLWNQALAENPNQGKPYYFRAQYYYRQKKWQATLRDLEQTLKWNPRFGPALDQRSRILNN